MANFVDGKFFITGSGKQFITGFEGIDESYSSQGFPESEKKAALRPERKFAFVEEGSSASVNRTVRRRSKRLREYAMIHFAEDDGRIICEGCGFEASSAYGPSALGLIEIHHKEPIAISGVIRKPLAEAVKSLSPLCPTCHRIVHMNSNTILSIKDLNRIIGNALS